MRAAQLFFAALLCCCTRIDAFPQDNDAIVSRIHRRHVDSTGIAAVGYSKRLHALEVEFLNGAIYRYDAVPASVYRAMIAADSKTRFYDDNVRGRYLSSHVRPRQGEN